MEALQECLSDRLCSSALSLGLSGAVILVACALVIFGSSWMLLRKQRQRHRTLLELGAVPFPELPTKTVALLYDENKQEVRRVA